MNTIIDSRKKDVCIYEYHKGKIKVLDNSSKAKENFDKMYIRFDKQEKLTRFSIHGEYIDTGKKQFHLGVVQSRFYI